MKSTDNKDLFRDDPKRIAGAWRAAAETCRQQFPDDEKRYAYYMGKAIELEAA